MADIINGVQVPFVPIIQKDRIIGVPNKTEISEKFDSIFQKELQQVKFSNHATQRLESRNIELSEAALYKLNEAVDKAEAKGSRDSLVMMDKTAFIVNVPNRTVVTALPVGDSEENVFTNIDSVVLAK